ncbi:MAG: hypothetical protein ACRYF3_04885 [Janthinobacterium lividum]
MATTGYDAGGCVETGSTVATWDVTGWDAAGWDAAGWDGAGIGL